MIVITEKELDDVKRALVIAMKTLDESAVEGSSDKALADRLEVIAKKLEA